ncbi:putative cyclin domain-containing protein [Helianthus debilis subsp. tardiflorus]
MTTDSVSFGGLLGLIARNLNSKKLIRKGDAALRYSDDDDEVSVSVAVSAIEKSEVTTRSECSVFQKEVTNGRDSHNNEENDVVSVSSRRDSPEAKFGTTSFNLSNTTIKDGESALKSTNITVNNDDETENCGESKLISAEIDLTCSEQLCGRDEVSGYSSAGCTDGNMESSEFEISSGFFTPSWFDSGSQFSERSIGDPIPSLTFQLFLIYRQKFCKSEFDTKISSETVTMKTNLLMELLPEDEEHEESYQMMKVRERRQVYLHDYAEEYCGVTEYGDLVVQQRLQMVHWIMEQQSASKDLQKETMFLGVSLLDRFLSKGYFRSKMELEIAGIACLTFATRIEENQPYNSIQQRLFNVGSNEYSRSEVVAMEWLVQDVLNFQCYLPTIYNFLWFYLKAARSDEEVDKTAKYLAVLALLGHEQLCFWPSTVAASLVSLACLAGNEQSSLQQIARV